MSKPGLDWALNLTPKSSTVDFLRKSMLLLRALLLESRRFSLFVAPLAAGNMSTLPVSRGAVNVSAWLNWPLLECDGHRGRDQVGDRRRLSRRFVEDAKSEFLPAHGRNGVEAADRKSKCDAGSSGSEFSTAASYQSSDRGAFSSLRAGMA